MGAGNCPTVLMLGPEFSPGSDRLLLSSQVNHLASALRYKVEKRPPHMPTLCLPICLAGPSGTRVSHVT